MRGQLSPFENAAARHLVGVCCFLGWAFTVAKLLHNGKQQALAPSPRTRAGPDCRRAGCRHHARSAPELMRLSCDIWLGDSKKYACDERVPSVLLRLCNRQVKQAGGPACSSACQTDAHVSPAVLVAQRRRYSERSACATILLLLLLVLVVLAHACCWSPSGLLAVGRLQAGRRL
jgi:hypothetical protein